MAEEMRKRLSFNAVLIFQWKSSLANLYSQDCYKVTNIHTQMEKAQFI